MGILSIWSLVCGVILKTGEPFGDGSQLVEIGPTVQGFDIGPHLWGTTFSASWLVTRQRASVAPERALPPPCLPTKVSRDSISYLCWVFGHRGWTCLLPLIWPSLCLASLTTPASFKVNVASFTFPFFFFPERNGAVPSFYGYTHCRKKISFCSYFIETHTPRNGVWVSFKGSFGV